MAEAGGSTRRLRPPADSPRPDSEIAAGAFWVQGLQGIGQFRNRIQRARYDAGASPATIRSGFP
jgi:hypothetical protein